MTATTEKIITTVFCFLIFCALYFAVPEAWKYIHQENQRVDACSAVGYTLRGPGGLRQCTKCGAVVYECQRHEQWHARGIQ